MLAEGPTGSGPLQLPFDGRHCESEVQACGVEPEHWPVHCAVSTVNPGPKARQAPAAAAWQVALLVQAPAMLSEAMATPSGGPAPGPHQRTPGSQLAPGETQTVPMPGMLIGLMAWIWQVATGPPAPMSSEPLRPNVSGTGS